MGYKFGAWAIAAESFNMSRMYDEDVLLYAATDAVSTLSLWNEIRDYVSSDSTSE